MLLDSCFFPYLTSDQSFYNPKYKIAKGLGFKYEMGCDPMGRIIWINGPYKASNHDVAIFRDKLKQSITLSDNELILGGDLTNKFKLENDNLKSIRCMIEKIFNIFKRFEAFKQPWDSTIEKHQQAVFLVGYCINESYEEMELKQIDNSIEEEEDQEESNNIESLLHHLDETREVNEPPLHFTSSSESDSSETENHEKPPSRIRVSKTRDQSLASFFSKIFSLFEGKKDTRILMIGLDGVSKSIFLYKLKLGDVVSTIPTIGFNVETIEYKN
ncbi:hypothetical protein ACTFIR_003541 [Dictyostelium discoideum]